MVKIYIAAMRILDEVQIRRKLSRLAIEVLERHADTDSLYLVGVNNNGYTTATELLRLMREETPDAEVHLRRVHLSPADPLHGGVRYAGDVGELAGQAVVIVDDVASTGRTAFYAAKPLMDVLPRSLEVAVLVDRRHKRFPVSSDYVGLTLSTTLKDDIRVYYEEGDWRVELV